MALMLKCAAVVKGLKGKWIRVDKCSTLSLLEV